MWSRAKIAGPLVFTVLLPTIASAQASIVGTVRDSSGGVLPGVTVEAASPALIEKVRTVSTDATGQYTIVDLRPGAYSVTFNLSGFATVKREGIELVGTFAATVSAELRVGTVEETVLVSGQAPVVDLRTTRHQQTMTEELIEALPSGRQYYSLANLVPSMSTGNRDVGGSVGVSPTSVTALGSKSPDSRLTIDGLNVGAGGGGATMYMTPASTSQEVTFNITGGLGESESPGTAINIIPKEGGNTYSGLFFVNGAGGGMVANNYTDELGAKGLRVPNSLNKVYDVNPAFGGRIVRDRVWFFGSARTVGTYNAVAGMYVNKNARDVTAWTYEPDLTQQAETDNFYYGGTLRLTWQATPRNKVSAFWDEQTRCVGCTGGGTATQTIEATTRSTAMPMRVGQVRWTSPLTSRLLAEAGLGLFGHRHNALPRTDDGLWNPLMIPAVEQAGTIPNLVYRAPLTANSGGFYRHDWTAMYPWKAALSFVTGAHSMKFGYDGGWSPRSTAAFCDTCLAYRFNNGVANLLWELASPWYTETDAYTTAFYAQDQWSLGPWTLQGGVRYDHYRVKYPAQSLGPAKYYPTQISFPETESYNWHDITPRIGATFDVFGNGKTAAKVTLGKYMAAGAISPRGGEIDDFNPIVRMAVSTSRAWTDANRNYLPDCDLLNPGAQDLRTSGGDFCGAFTNLNYGTPNVSTRFDPDYVRGWGNRPYQWLFVPSVQQELWPGVSLNVAYIRRWAGNLPVTDNLALGPGDFDQFSLDVPADPRLPGGGGYTVTGLFNVKPAKFGQTNNLRTASSKYGKPIEHFDAIDLDVNARLHGVTVQGGLSAGKLTTDNCDLVANVPEILLPVVTPSLDLRANTVNNVWQPASACHVETPFLTNYKFVGTYTVPRIDVQVGATYQNLAGPEQAATYNAPTAYVARFLGRPLAGNAPNMPIAILEPGSQYGERYNQLDLRFGKIFRTGRIRSMVAVDLYNALNDNRIVSYNNTFVPGGRWLAPTAIEVARVIKLSAQVDF